MTKEEVAMTYNEDSPINAREGYINSWYVFYVKSGEENKAKINLEKVCESKKLKIDFVIPSVIRFEKKGMQRIRVRKTVFPGYVFANGSIDVEAYKSLKGITGVYRMLRDKNTYDILPVPASEMELLGSLMNVYGVIEAPEISFKEGQIAVISKGPLASYKGNIVKVDKHRRKITLLIPFLGEDRKVEVGFSFAEYIEQEAAR